MKIVKCPICGNDIIINKIGPVECSCGACVPGLEKDEINSRKIKNRLIIFLLIYNAAIIFLIGLLFYLVKNVNKTIPIFTTIPTLAFMIIGETIFLVNYVKMSRRFKSMK